MIELMERTTAGFTVTLSYVAHSGRIVLEGETEQHYESVSVEPSEALRAFWHPCTYLEDAARFFDRRTTENEEGENEDAYEDFRENGGEGFSEAV